MSDFAQHALQRLAVLTAAGALTLGGTSAAVAGPAANVSTTAASVLASQAASTPAVATPSGESMPVGDLPGWRQIFTDDFTGDVPLGSFPSAVSSKWGAYKAPGKDTSGYGTYSPSSVVSASGGVLNSDIHTDNGVAMVAAVVPKLVPVTYGRFAVRYRFDAVAGYKMAWMLWPDSNNSQRDGEIDFPEMDLDQNIGWAFVHPTNNTGPDDKAWFKTPLSAGAWHTAVIEWSPNLVVFSLDGSEIGRTTQRVPSTAMHWVLQTETGLHLSAAPAASARGNVQVDWLAVWAYDATPADSIGGMSPTLAKAANGDVAEVWPAGGQLQVRTLSGAAWSPPAALASLPNGLTVRSSTAAVGVNYLGNLEVHVVASDGQVWHSYAAGGASNWSAWSPLGAPAVPIAGDVAVGTNSFGNQELYVRATDGQVFHKFATPGQGSGWSGWDSMGHPAAGVRGDVAVGKNSFGNQELYIVGNDARPYHNFATPGVGSGWNGWDLQDGPVAPVGDVSAAINYLGNQELYFVGTDGNVWHNYATPGSGSGWVGWSPLGAPAGVTVTGDVSVQPHDYSIIAQQWIRVTASNGATWQNTQTPGAGTGWSGWVTSTS